MSSSDSRDHVSPSQLAKHAYCPRCYDFAYAQQVRTPDSSKRYLQQGSILHKTIARTCDAVRESAEAEEIGRIANEIFSDVWAEVADRDEYSSNAHYEYHQQLTQKGIEAFFEPDGGDGIEHARQSVAVEESLQCVHQDVPLYGYTDNILRTDDTVHLIDYKRNLNGIISSGTADRLKQHLDGEAHEASRVKNAIQAAAYIEGIKETEYYESGMDVRFSFYGLLNKTEMLESPDGYSVSARGWGREITDVYADHYVTIWELISKAYTGIQNGDYDPEPWEFIYEEACEGCDYRQMCPDYLSQEVRL